MTQQLQLGSKLVPELSISVHGMPNYTPLRGESGH